MARAPMGVQAGRRGPRQPMSSRRGRGGALLQSLQRGPAGGRGARSPGGVRGLAAGGGASGIGRGCAPGRRAASG